MEKYHEHFSTKQTPQSEPIPGREAEQKQNRAGGFVFAVDAWTQLDRFLILGTEGNTYYATAREMTRENAKNVLACIKQDGKRVVKRVVEISDAGRAPKNDPALFVLALAASEGDPSVKREAYQALSKVARIGTHLFHFAEYKKAMGGLGGNGFKRAIGRWYNQMPVNKLALQVVKYQQRDGWSHRDLLRLAHVRPKDGDKQSILEYVVKGLQNGVPLLDEVPEHLRIIGAAEHAKTLVGSSKVKQLVHLISDYRLPHECVPNEMKKHPDVWEAMLPSMGITALMRNLNKMTAVGLLSGTSAATGEVIKRLTNPEDLKRGRVHPMNVLMALKTYQQGCGMRGSMTWEPVGQVVDALDDAFYLAFDAVEPTGKAVCVALDISGSMVVPVNGFPFLTCRVAAAAMAMTTIRTEKRHEVLGFTCQSDTYGRHGDAGEDFMSFGAARMYGWAGSGVGRLTITPRQRLDDVCKYCDSLPMGGTDAAMPVQWALAKKQYFDVFLIYTDNETWAGDMHVTEALRRYRDSINPNAKLVSVAFAANDYSVADPNDAGMMDVCGFDSAIPNILRDFMAPQD
jgi:60 kDa SS-A/Ro ribonucleoprotein